MTTRTLELTCERNQRPAIVISGSVRKTAAHLIGPAASDASLTQAENPEAKVETPPAGVTL